MCIPYKGAMVSDSYSDVCFAVHFCLAHHVPTFEDRHLLADPDIAIKYAEPKPVTQNTK